MRYAWISFVLVTVLLAPFSTRASQEDYSKPLLQQDLRFILRTEEVAAFKRLTNDNERDIFLESFWRRRDPTPETYDNEFKNEHYRRLRYSLDHFSHCTPGYLTDRGHAYILFGEPDEVQETQTNGNRAVVWRYKKYEGAPRGFSLQFVDTCGCGDYKLERDQATDDLLQTLLQKPRTPRDLQLGVGIEKPRFRDLLVALDPKVTFKLVPFTIESESAQLTDASDWVTIRIVIPSEKLAKDPDNTGLVHVQAVVRLMTLTGKVAELIELESREQSTSTSESYVITKSLPVRPGRYRIEIAIKDMVADRIGTNSRVMFVPNYEPIANRFLCSNK